VINSCTGLLLPNADSGGRMLKSTIRNAIYVRPREVGMLIITKMDTFEKKTKKINMNAHSNLVFHHLSKATCN
jgi:hypothetical protein